MILPGWVTVLPALVTVDMRRFEVLVGRSAAVLVGRSAAAATGAWIRLAELHPQIMFLVVGILCIALVLIIEWARPPIALRQILLCSTAVATVAVILVPCAQGTP